MDAIINERVLDIGFRADLERKQGFCRRHVAELVPTDRRVTGGILGSSMLLSAVIDRRIGRVRDGVGSRGRRIRVGLKLARTRPPCVACTQGETAVRTAVGRFAGAVRRCRPGPTRSARPRSASTTSSCSGTGRAPDATFEPVARRQLARFEDLRRRLDGYAHHSSHDRVQLMTDEERGAADDATRVLGGDSP